MDKTMSLRNAFVTCMQLRLLLDTKMWFLSAGHLLMCSQWREMGTSRERIIPSHIRDRNRSDCLCPRNAYVSSWTIKRT